MKKTKKNISVESVPTKKTRLKKFNLKEELIDNGWEKLKQAGYKAKRFGFLEGFFSLLCIGALVWLNLYRGFFNFTVGGLTAIPLLVLGVAAFTLGEFMFYFIFLHGRHRKLNFIKETIPYKTIAYIVGGVTAIISPIAALLVALIVPFALNHAFANWVTKGNFDRRAEHYEPHKYVDKEEVEYEEPKAPIPKLQQPKFKKQTKIDAPEASLSADLNGPQISAIAPKEWGAHYDTLDKAKLDSDYDDSVVSIAEISESYKKAKSFIYKHF